jgi:hypothetical protein
MRLILWLLLILATVGAPGGFTSRAEAQTAAWSGPGERVTFRPAKISFPARPAMLSLRETREASHPGEALDAIALYGSADQEIYATVYVYLPGLAHNGLAAIATDQAIKANSPRPVTNRGMRIAAAGGKPGVAIVTDYSGYKDNLATEAAFIKADRWMVKLRVSGPEARRAEVEAAMSALLDGLLFEGKAKAWQAMPIEAAPCSAPAGPDARALPDDYLVNLQNTIMYGALDPAGEPSTRRGDAPIPSRIGTAWCRDSIEAGSSRIALLRSTENGEAERRSVMFALFSDAGGVLEVVRMEHGGYVAILHRIGVTDILGTWDGMPSPKQLGDLLYDKGQAAKQAREPRARMTFKSNGNSEMTLTPASTPPAAPRT